MKDIRFGDAWIRRDGNKILIDSSRWRDDLSFIPDLVLVLTDDGGVDVDPEWKAQIKARAEHQRVWATLVSELHLDDFVERRIYYAAPSLKITDRKGMIEHLQLIVSGRFKVRGLGKKGHDLLAQKFADWTTSASAKGESERG